MHISKMTESKYLKQDDVGEGKLVTIKGIARTNVAREDEEPEYKYTMAFQETDKPLVMNSTNIQLCARACNSEDTDDWIGQKIVLYTDPNVSYAGKLVGGIRIRQPKGQAQRTAAPQGRAPSREEADARMAAESAAAASGDPFGDDVPFAPLRKRALWV